MDHRGELSFHYFPRTLVLEIPRGEFPGIFRSLDGLESLQRRAKILKRTFEQPNKECLSFAFRCRGRRGPSFRTRV